MPNHYPSTKFINANGDEVTLTWIPTKNVDEYRPYFQVYGVVFNHEGKILLIQEKGKWKIPGGTPEPGESAESTLRRELLEEADVTIKQLTPIGVQRVDYPNNPKTSEGDVFYQYRYACFLDKIHEPTPDPDTGITNPRIFVPAEGVTQYVDWGSVGKAMFEAAAKTFKSAKE